MQANVKTVMTTHELELELERQNQQLKLHMVELHELHSQLHCSKQEVAWLRDRVCQLQQVQHARKSLAARMTVDQPMHL